MERTQSGSIESLVELAQTYFDYVTERAVFYDVIWGDGARRLTQESNFGSDAPGFAVLLDAVEAYRQKHALNNLVAQEIALELWAITHGFSALVVSGLLDSTRTGQGANALLVNAVTRYLAGL